MYTYWIQPFELLSTSAAVKIMLLTPIVSWLSRTLAVINRLASFALVHGLRNATAIQMESTSSTSDEHPLVAQYIAIMLATG